MRIAGVFPPQAALRSAAPTSWGGGGWSGFSPVHLVELEKDKSIPGLLHLRQCFH